MTKYPKDLIKEAAKRGQSQNARRAFWRKFKETHRPKSK